VFYPRRREDAAKTPLSLFAQKVVPALAAGCTVVLKPFLPFTDEMI
jgi:hypothetical protein